MIQMNLRTAKSNKETNLNYKQIWAGLVELPFVIILKLAGEFFSN